VCLHDPISATLWADAWRGSADTYRAESPMSVLRALEKRFGQAKRLHVVVAPTLSEADATFQGICEKTAFYIWAFVEQLARERLPGTEPIRIAIPWGKTADRIINALETIQSDIEQEVEESQYSTESALQRPASPYEICVIPLIGIFAKDHPDLEANELVKRLVSIYGGDPKDPKAAIQIPHRAFSKRDQYKDSMLGEAGEEFAKADLVLLWGAPLRPDDPEHLGLTEKASVPREMIEEASQRGAVGDVCGEFLSPAGEPIESPDYCRVGFAWSDLRAIAQDPQRRVVFVVGADEDYLPLAEAVMKAAVASTLITDASFGSALLEHDAATRPLTVLTGQQV
jgi:hypothetical protein